MRRVPPSMLIREELDRLLAEGAGPEQNLILELVQTVTRLVVQQLLDRRADRLSGWPGPLSASGRRPGSAGIPQRICGEFDSDC